MSERLTKAWTDDAEGAYGEKGAQGDRGEPIGQEILQTLGFSKVTHHPADKNLQKKGWDLILEKDGMCFGIDVKHNLRGQQVCVDKNKIWKSQAHFWLHINPDNKHDWIIYKVEDMRSLITENNMKPTLTKGGYCYFIPRNEIP